MGCVLQGIKKREERDNERAKKRKEQAEKRKAKESPTKNKGKKTKKKQTVPMKARKIRIYPNQEQRQILARWFGTARWTYNRCLDAIEKEQVKKNKKELRAKCLNAAAFEANDSLKWVLDTPYDIRDEAMADLLKAYDSNFAKKKIDGTHKFKMKYRTKKQPQECITIRARYWKQKRGEYSKIFGDGILKLSESVDNVESDMRLIRTRSLGKYYLCIPVPIDVKPVDNQDVRVASLDPGVRCFQSVYSPSSSTFTEFGKGDMSKIYRLCLSCDKLQSRWSQRDCRKRKRYRLKKAAARIRLKIRNLVDELHRKTTRWLLENHNVILIPLFETQQMVRRGARRIRSKTARSMITWSHYRFRMSLINKAREHPDCRVIEVTEEFTSKTCGCCGHIHQKLGGSKVFNCPVCGTTMDRDLNGARNILIRYMSLNYTHVDVNNNDIERAIGVIPNGAVALHLGL